MTRAQTEQDLLQQMQETTDPAQLALIEQKLKVLREHTSS